MKALEKIVVRRPTPPPWLLQEAPGFPQETTPPTRLNPEFEQKPLAELDVQRSENLHGGSELTFSMSSGAERRQGPGGDVSWRSAAPQQQSRADISAYFDVPAELLYVLPLLRHNNVFNELQAISLEPAKHQRSLLRYLQSEFYRLIEMLGEEETKQFDYSCAKTKYNVRKMIMKRYEGKPPTRYKMPIVREGVMLILDNSGSMMFWAHVLATLAELAAQRRGIEIYVAPNGKIKEQILPAKRRIDHDRFIEKTAGRVIIYVGDFDGGDTPVRLSWKNTVYWIAPEDRYRRFSAHNWMHYEEWQFKGFFIRVFTLEDIFGGLKKAVSGVRWIDKCDICDDEREDYEE